MKCFVILSALLALVVADTYTPDNDNLDIEAVVKDPASLTAFHECFVDKAPCDAVAADFKKDLPEAVQEACAKCTPAQKHIFKRFLESLKENNKEAYNGLKQKYDPQDKYFNALEQAIATA